MATTGPAWAQPFAFTDATEGVGLVYSSTQLRDDELSRMLGGGVAADVNHDGMLDCYISSISYNFFDEPGNTLMIQQAGVRDGG